MGFTLRTFDWSTVVDVSFHFTRSSFDVKNVPLVVVEQVVALDLKFLSLQQMKNPCAIDADITLAVIK